MFIYSPVKREGGALLVEHVSALGGIRSPYACIRMVGECSRRGGGGLQCRRVGWCSEEVSGRPGRGARGKKAPKKMRGGERKTKVDHLAGFLLH